MTEPTRDPRVRGDATAAAADLPDGRPSDERPSDERPSDERPSDPRLDAELDATSDLVTASLAQLLRPPADLGSRTRATAAATLMSRSLFGTLADIAGVGWQTVRVLVGEEEER